MAGMSLPPLGINFRHCGSIPTSLMTLPHLSVSSAISLGKSEVGPANGMEPNGKTGLQFGIDETRP